MNIICDYCGKDIPIGDLAALQRDGLACPHCGTVHFIISKGRTAAISLGQGNSMKGMSITFSGDVAGRDMVKPGRKR